MRSVGGGRFCPIVAALVVCLLSLSAIACTAAPQQGDAGAGQGVGADQNAAESPDGTEPYGSAIEKLDELGKKADEFIKEELDARESSIPQHVPLGTEINAGKLAVKVLKVAPGPHDAFRNTDTVEVNVSLRNTTGKVVVAGFANWSVDAADGSRRSPRKTWIRDGAGKKLARSFLAVKVSPNRTYKGSLYFDATGISAVVFKRSLLDSQNQYVYFDVG